MKNYLSLLFFLVFYQAIYSQQAQGVFSINGVSASTTMVTCNEGYIPFTFITPYNYCESGVTYSFQLIKDGSVVQSQSFNGNQSGAACQYDTNGNLISIPPVIGSFGIQNPAPGTYKMHYKASFGITLIEYDSNSIVLTNPFYGTYLGCGNCYENSSSSCHDDLRVFDFEADSLLYVLMDSGLMYKVKKNYGTGYNMLAIDDDTLNSLPGYDYIIGYQNFEEKINAVEYTADGKLLIGFDDGKILKINGLGGGGMNMFAVNESNSNFSGVAGYSYYSGSHKFNSAVTEIKQVNGVTFVCLSSGKILKVNGSGGSGLNLFAISENSNGFTGLNGYNYYIGHAYFSSSVFRIFSNSVHTFFSFNNNKLLKINQTGGGGMNMFAVNETSGGFSGISGYNYYIGHTQLSGKVIDMEFQGAYTTLGFSNGKLLKVNGTGGSGMNMFAVDETAGGFNPISGYNYYVGQAKYSSGVKEILSIPANGVTKPITFITFENGGLLKSTGIGGSGMNMYNATENSLGFVTTSTGYTQYLLGSSNFDVEPTDIAYIPTSKQTILCFNNRKAFKSIGVGGTGYNCFAVSQEDNGFAPLYGYNYVVGTQLFPCDKKFIFHRSDDDLKDTAESKISANANDAIQIINPFSNELTIDFSQIDVNKKVAIQINNMNGQIIYEDDSYFNEEIINTSHWAKGVYICVISIDGVSHHKKIIKN